MKKIMTLDLKLKGKRNYLHGTDIFNDTMSWLCSQREEISDINFSFHRQAFNQLTVVLGDLSDIDEPVAVCSFSSCGIREKAFLVETNQKVTARYSYSEDELISRMKIDFDKRIGVLSGEVTFTEIEILVAMTKALHQHIFPECSGKWLFVKARMNAYNKHLGLKNRSIVIAAIFNNKLTRCEIFYEESKVGEIYVALT